MQFKSINILVTFASKTILLLKKTIHITVWFYLLLMGFGPSLAFAHSLPKHDHNFEISAAQKNAIRYLDSIGSLEKNELWPNIKPAQYFENIKRNVLDPKTIYPGNGTNFCGYGALTYLFLIDDPLGYAHALIQLYKEGHTKVGKVYFRPSASIRKQAGLLKYKGILDIHPAEQLWFLCLADHFKGYLNLFNHHYDPGDEDSFWASVNYAKFNRMVRAMLRYNIKCRGADLLRPAIADLYEYLSEHLTKGPVVLYINNRMVHKKNHVRIKLGIPTHFVVAESISKMDNIITLIYWDYGGRTLIQLSPEFLKRIVFGITTCTQINKNETE